MMRCHRPLNPANSRIYMRANWLLFPKSVVCKSKLRSKHTPNRPKNSKSSIGSRTEITKSKRSIRKGRATLRLWLCLKLSMENWTIIRRPVLSKAACRGLVSIQMEALFLWLAIRSKLWTRHLKKNSRCLMFWWSIAFWQKMKACIVSFQGWHFKLSKSKVKTSKMDSLENFSILEFRLSSCL